VSQRRPSIARSTFQRPPTQLPAPAQSCPRLTRLGGCLLAGRAVVAGVTAGPLLGRPPAVEPQRNALGSGLAGAGGVRLIAPGSEWKLHREWFGNSAMADLLGPCALSCFLTRVTIHRDVRHRRQLALADRASEGRTDLRMATCPRGRRSRLIFVGIEMLPKEVNNSRPRARTTCDWLHLKSVCYPRAKSERARSAPALQAPGSQGRRGTGYTRPS
jgi:hypothetical protein